MNEITVYQSPEEMKRDRERLRKPKDSYAGYVYAVEFGDHVKIGSTDNPINRINSLASMARNYCFAGIGRVALSPVHSNFRTNEMILHAVFSEKRIADGELFDVSFDSAVEALSKSEFTIKEIDEHAEEEEIKRSLEYIYNPSSDPVLRRFEIFSICDRIQAKSRALAEKSQEYSRLMHYAPKGTKTFFGLIDGYSKNTRRAIYEKMKSFSIEKQKRILGRIFREKALPGFLKTIAEGE